MLLAGRPWDVGYAAARRLRADVGLGDQRPVRSTGQMGELFGNTEFRPLATRDEAVRATVLENVQAPAIQLGRHGRPSSELFAMARAIGDVYCYGDARRFPVMDNELTRRQQIGRAFAAEFVAPGEEVIRMSNAGRRIEEIAEHFGASTQLIDHQFENAPRWLGP